MLGEVLERWLLLEHWHLFEVPSRVHCLGKDLVINWKEVLFRLNIGYSLSEVWWHQRELWWTKRDWLQTHRSDLQLQLGIILDLIDPLGQDSCDTEFRLEGTWCYNRKYHQAQHYNCLVLSEEVQGFDRSLGGKAATSIHDTMRLRNISYTFSMLRSQTAERLYKRCQ
jgi:hypothetical protein